MKTTFYIRLCALLIFGILFVSCEKDLYTDNIRQDSMINYSVRKISYREVTKDAAAMRKLGDINATTFMTPLKARGIYSEEYGVYIDTTNIKVIYSDSLRSLTFKIIDNEGDLKLKNLVLKSKLAESYKAFVTEYDLTDVDLDKLKHGAAIDRDKLKTIKNLESNLKYTVGPCIRYFTTQISSGPDPSGSGNPINTGGDEVPIVDLNCLSGQTGNGYANGFDYSGYNPSNGNSGNSGGGGNYDINDPQTNPYSDASYHGQSGFVPTIPTIGEDDQPCSGLKELMTKTANSTGTPSTVGQLISTLQSTYNSNREHRYFLSPPDNPVPGSADFAEYAFMGPVGGDGVGFVVGNYAVSVVMHSHYDPLVNTFSMFDLYTIYQLIKPPSHMNNIPAFTSIVVTAAGTVHALKIEDSSAFISWAQSYFLDFDPINPSIENTMEKFAQIKFESFARSGASIADNENGMANFLNKKGTGLKLYKADTNFTNWRAVSAGSSGPQFSPCQ